MAVTTDFASPAGRIMMTERGLDGESPEVCFVALAVPKSRGSDPLQIIEEAVAPHGWTRDGEATWVSTDGFKVRVRDESQPDDPGYPTADFEVLLYGTAD